MSDSQRFPVAAHALAYLAHKGAYDAAHACPSAILAASVPTNPVVIRRVTALLSKAGLIATRPGASGVTGWQDYAVADDKANEWTSSPNSPTTRRSSWLRNKAARLAMSPP